MIFGENAESLASRPKGRERRRGWKGRVWEVTERTKIYESVRTVLIFESKLTG